MFALVRLTGMMVGITLSMVGLSVAATEHGFSAPASVTIILDLRQTTSQQALPQMRKEFEEVLRVPGLEVGWRVLGAETPREVFERVVMVRLNGRCASGPVSGGPYRGEAMGYTHMSGGVVLPFVEIDCDRVRWAVAAGDRTAAPHRAARFVGRALGRVLAHEVYHVLAGTREHTNHGVGRPALTSAELICEDFGFDESCLRAIRKALGNQTAAANRSPERNAPAFQGLH